MKLLMLGYFGFGNTGDEAILAAEVAALREVLGEAAEFVVISADPAHTREVHDLPAVNRTSFAAIWAQLRASDGLVAGGGSLLQDVTSARPVAFYGGVMLAARLLRRPVFGYAQGLGPVRRRGNRWLAGQALRRSTQLSLRDPESVELAKRLGVPTVEQVPDPVLGMSIAAPGTGRKRVAVALRPWAGMDDWLPAVQHALSAIAAAVELVFVPFHGGQDVDLAHRLAAGVGAGQVVESDGSYAAALEAVASADVVLGMRLHALVAAAAAGRPFVAVSYDPKVHSFADLVGQPVAARVPGPVDAAALEAAIRDSIETGATTDYTARLAALRAQAHRPAACIASYYLTGRTRPSS